MSEFTDSIVLNCTGTSRLTCLDCIQHSIGLLLLYCEARETFFLLDKVRAAPMGLLRSELLAPSCLESKAWTDITVRLEPACHPPPGLSSPCPNPPFHLLLNPLPACSDFWFSLSMLAHLYAWAQLTPKEKQTCFDCTFVILQSRCKGFVHC